MTSAAAAPVARAAATDAPKAPAKLPFAKVLREAGFTPKPLGPPALPKRLEPGTVLRAPPKPPPLPSASARAAAPATSQLQLVRSDAHATAAGLKARRDATTHDDRGAQLERAVDLIGQELKRDFTLLPPPMQPATNLQQQPPPPVDPAARAQATLQLIERIELFTRQNRPALSLALPQSLGARVEIERAGKGAVSMTWVGVNGPPRPDDVQRVREALASRGLSLRSLTVR